MHATFDCYSMAWACNPEGRAPLTDKCSLKGLPMYWQNAAAASWPHVAPKFMQASSGLPSMFRLPEQDTACSAKIHQLLAIGKPMPIGNPMPLTTLRCLQEHFTQSVNIQVYIEHGSDRTEQTGEGVLSSEPRRVSGPGHVDLVAHWP